MVNDSEDEVVDLAFDDGYAVTGVVLSSRPLTATARVMIQGLESDRATSIGSTVIEIDGSFLLEDVSPGSHTLTVVDST